MAARTSRASRASRNSTPTVQLTTSSTTMRWMRNAFFVVICAALLFEAEGPLGDPFATIGYYLHSNVSSWLDCSIKDCTLKFSNVKLIFSPLEMMLLALLGLWLLYRRNHRPKLKITRGTLFLPLMVFAGMLVFGVLWGEARGGGNITIALWEVRGFMMLILMYFIVGIFITEESHLNTLVRVVFIAATGLAIENILRWLIMYGAQTPDDLGYDHVDSVVLAFAALLCINLLLFGGTRGQKRWAIFLLPTIVFALDVMNRRAAFAVLAVGAVVMVLLILRLRPRLFWTVVSPCVVVVLIYLAVFWHGSGALAAPARAISSMFSPDPRDYASNIYRTLEKLDILENLDNATARLLGLGFGQPFIFYVALPDLSFWPFWHYTPHNNILWIWLKDGALGFLAFFWLLGRAAYDGAVALDTQREQWNLVAVLRKRLNRGQGRRAANTQKPSADLPFGFGVVTGRGRSKISAKDSLYDDLRWNVPSWQRSDDKKSATVVPSGVIAVLATCICIIPAQVAYSYVDLGLTSERDMLLFGLAIGILARAQVPLSAMRAKLREDRSVRRRGFGAPPVSNDEPEREPAGTVQAD